MTHTLSILVPNAWSTFGFIFSLSHFLSAFLSSCPPAPLSLSAQADRKCQVRPGYFRPNWEIDVPPETWHLDMHFILPHALPPKRQSQTCWRLAEIERTALFQDFSQPIKGRDDTRVIYSIIRGKPQAVRESLKKWVVVLTTFISQDFIEPVVLFTEAVEMLIGCEYPWMGWKNRGISPS